VKDGAATVADFTLERRGKTLDNLSARPVTCQSKNI